ncbi:unnamed protein product, partial [Rotaria sp. Silwood1]
MPTDIFLSIYEVHIRGYDFPDQMTSDEESGQGDYMEHIWFVNSPPLEIQGISERQEYTVFVRALFNVQGSNDMKCTTLVTTSNEEITTQINPLIDFLTRPLL